MSRKIGLLLLLLLFLVPICLQAKEVRTFKQPILITSLGQNPDGLMVKVVLEKNNISYNYLPQASIKEIEVYKSIIITVGVSCKGLNAANIQYQHEVKRAEEILKRTLDNRIPIILVHFGGSARRDSRSNHLIEMIAPYSSYLIIYQDSNNDNYFTKLAEEKNISLELVDKLYNIEKVFCEIFTNESD